MKLLFIIKNKHIIEVRVIANKFNKYFVFVAFKLNGEVLVQPGNFKQFMSKSEMHNLTMVNYK